MCDALHHLLDNIFVRFGSKLYRHIVGVPMGTNCAPLVADLFLFRYERDFLNKAIGIINCAKTFSKFYRRCHDLISKFQVGLKSLLRQGLSEADFYGDLMYKLKKIVGSNFQRSSLK